METLAVERSGVAPTPVSYRRLTEIALPIMLGGVAQNIIGVTDTAFLARLGPVELSAGALGSILFFVFSILGLALGTGAQIVVARRIGEGRDGEVGLTVDQALYLKLALALVCFALLRFGVEPLAPLLSPDPRVSAALVEYMSWRAYEIIPALLFWTARGFYTGVGWTTVVIYATSVMASVNVLGDWLLIFGNWGFPAMGIGGAALASTISETLGLSIMVLVAYGRGYVGRFQLFRFPAIDWPRIRELARLSGPLVLQNLLSILGWFLLFLLIGYMGTVQLAAANVVRSLYMVALIPVWAFATAANSLVSNVIGQGRKRLVLMVARRAVILSTLVCITLSLPLVLSPNELLSAFAADPAVVQAALPNLPVLVAALAVAGAAFTLLQVVLGTGATGFAFRAEVISIALYVGYLLVVTQVFRVQQPVVWMVEVWYCLLMGLICLWYLRRGTWRLQTL